MPDERVMIINRLGKEVTKRWEKSKKRDIRAVAAIGVLIISKNLKSTYFLAMRMVMIEEVAIMAVA